MPDLPFLRGKKKKLLGNSHNVTLALMELPEIAGSIALDTRAHRVMALRETFAGPAGPWTDAHTTATTNWLQGLGLPTTPPTVAAAVELVASRCGFDPVADWLDGLRHDGTPRLGRWLHTHLGAADTPLNTAIGRMTLIGAAARGLTPGRQLDTTTVLEGPQGSLKSSAVRILGGPFGAEHLPDFHTKDAILVAASAWIIEISELTALRRSDVVDINSFLTRRVDHFRPPYARHVVSQPRGCCLIGTTNADFYLKDERGGRRFWPVRTGEIKLELLQKEVAQLWAEAVVAFRNEEPWWPGMPEMRELFEIRQGSRFEGDSWEEAIVDTAARLGTDFTLENVATAAFSTADSALPKERIDRAMETRIGRILAAEGYRRRWASRNGRRIRLYVAPDQTPGTAQLDQDPDDL
jgi:predicted P-loop ATPase